MRVRPCLPTAATAATSPGPVALAACSWLCAGPRRGNTPSAAAAAAAAAAAHLRLGRGLNDQRCEAALEIGHTGGGQVDVEQDLFVFYPSVCIVCVCV